MIFFFNSVTIAFVNLMLSGDNAILIAMVTRSLPSHLQKRSIAIAASCDVIARTAATFFASQLMREPLLKFMGGILILSISLRLFRAAGSNAHFTRNFETCWSVVGFLVTADLLMSTDNTVATAALSHGRISLLFAGMAMSIPLVFWLSHVVSEAMARYSFTVYAGAGFLGFLGAKMIVTDAIVLRTLRLSNGSQFGIECTAAAAVLTTGLLLRLKFG